MSKLEKSLNEIPYSITRGESEFVGQLQKLEEQVSLLRADGKLTESTLKDYYGETRYEQVAESNAIEGSTLSTGETELAILKGMTITGHDPVYSRDAIALNEALTELAKMARELNPTDKEQLLNLHNLIMGERPGGGIFRNQSVIIRGATHKPPQTWNEIMEGMEAWERWSLEYRDLPVLLRATILHAWLSHVHPFIDGNGRTARAVTNLELVRGGYPSIIIRKKERSRYIESLVESDAGGDIRSFFELIIERADGALRGLELSAKKQQGFNPGARHIRIDQERHLQIWHRGVSLLVQMIEHYLSKLLEGTYGSVTIKEFEAPVDMDDYVALIGREPVAKAWSFILTIAIPAGKKLDILAYVGYRSPPMYHHMNDVGGPAIFWSEHGEVKK